MNIFQFTVSEISDNQITVVHVFIEAHVDGGGIGKDLVGVALFKAQPGMKQKVMHAFVDQYGM